jgi:hypothetical protein
MKTRDTTDWMARASERRGADREVTRLIERIRGLVNEQKRLEASPQRQRREANRREIAALQNRLANLVRRDLSR